MSAIVLLILLRFGDLTEALQAYRAMPDWPQIEAGPALRKGDRGPRVAMLRARLGLPAADLFDDTLDAAVRDMQQHHGLTEDGIVGRATLTELNVTRAERIRQIETNIERRRELANPGERYLLVNIAAFHLEYVDRGVVRESMRIIVGKEYTRTPVFSARVEQVVINPPWNVPASIATKELWPKQRHDASYFAREHIRVVSGRLRQDPGPWCALGQVKFHMPNHYDVYLHDTPAKTLFDRDLRAFSHGCIRLQRPVDLAVALTNCTREDIEATTATRRETWIALPEPIPVHVVYWTAFIATDGHVEFRRDVYRKDLQTH